MGWARIGDEDRDRVVPDPIEPGFEDRSTALGEPRQPFHGIVPPVAVVIPVTLAVMVEFETRMTAPPTAATPSPLSVAVQCSRSMLDALSAWNPVSLLPAATESLTVASTPLIPTS